MANVLFLIGTDGLGDPHIWVVNADTGDQLALLQDNAAPTNAMSRCHYDAVNDTLYAYGHSGFHDPTRIFKWAAPSGGAPAAAFFTYPDVLGVPINISDMVVGDTLGRIFLADAGTPGIRVLSIATGLPLAPINFLDTTGTPDAAQFLGYDQGKQKLWVVGTNLVDSDADLGFSVNVIYCVDPVTGTVLLSFKGSQLNGTTAVDFIFDAPHDRAYVVESDDTVSKSRIDTINSVAHTLLGHVVLTFGATIDLLVPGSMGVAPLLLLRTTVWNPTDGSLIDNFTDVIGSGTSAGFWLDSNSKYLFYTTSVGTVRVDPGTRASTLVFNGIFSTLPGSDFHADLAVGTSLPPRDWDPDPAWAGSGFPNAFPTTWRTVRFIGIAPDHAVSPSGIGDALNPASWLIHNRETGAPFTVLQAAQVAPTTFDITVQEQLPSHLHELTVGSPGLLLSGVMHAFTFTIQGMLWREVFTPDGASARKRRVGTDLDNKPTPLPQSSLIGGTLTIRGGDYATVQGPELVKKLQLRRLTTRRGGFFHLPNYGLGVLASKQPLPITDLLKQKAEIERQARLEPEVQSVACQLTVDAGGIVALSVTSQLHATDEQTNITIDRSGVPGA